MFERYEISRANGMARIAIQFLKALSEPRVSFRPCFGAGIMSVGFNPPAPPLDDLVDMSDTETFWVVKNGLRCNGIPGWQASNTDVELWDIVAFFCGDR